MFDFRSRLHIQISPERITVRNLKSGVRVSEVPELALGGAPRKLLAAGDKARFALGTAAHTEVINPFAHPRSLISDFSSAQLLLRYFVRRVAGRTWLQGRPLVFLQPMGNPEGGYTQIERRALHELALGAGASQVVVCLSAAPTDQEMLATKMKISTRFIEI